ncbi:MAG TPA: hypothetical protein VE032_05705 [Actinomycetota bacterium]|nr:hypothetical protein [Actinomycetota bacterium]
MRALRGVVACLALAVGAAACSTPSPDARADLCSDMGNLRATVVGLTRIPEDGRIGAVRGDLEKLDPTFGNVSRSGLVPEPVLQPMLQAHVGYRDAIWDLGDDETYRAVPSVVRAQAGELLVAYQAVVDALGCQPAAAAVAGGASAPSAGPPGM